MCVTHQANGTIRWEVTCEDVVVITEAQHPKDAAMPAWGHWPAGVEQPIRMGLVQVIALSFFEERIRRGDLEFERALNNLSRATFDRFRIKSQVAAVAEAEWIDEEDDFVPFPAATPVVKQENASTASYSAAAAADSAADSAAAAADSATAAMELTDPATDSTAPATGSKEDEHKSSNDGHLKKRKLTMRTTNTRREPTLTTFLTSFVCCSCA